MKFLNRPFSMSLMLISLAWFGFSACTGALPEDKDGLHTGAQVLFQGVNIDDKVDQKRGDKADWRKIHAAQRGDMIVTLTMAPGSVNQVTGHLSVYDHTVQPLRDVQIQPGDGRYTITAPVQAGRDYFIRVASDRGASGYRLLVSLRAADPCALCTDDQECVNGACVARAEEDPCGGCSDDRVCDAEIEQCVFPRCVGKRCKRRHFCNRRGRCVPSARCPRGKERVRGRCVAKCRRGERRVRGNCVARPKTVTCGSGERREGNRCVPVAADMSAPGHERTHDAPPSSCCKLCMQASSHACMAPSTVVRYLAREFPTRGSNEPVAAPRSLVSVCRPHCSQHAGPSFFPVARVARRRHSIGVQHLLHLYPTWLVPYDVSHSSNRC